MSNTDKPSEFLKKLDLSKLDANTATFIRSELMAYHNVDLLAGSPEFEEVKKMIEENYPQALGIIPVPEKDIKKFQPKKIEPIKVQPKKVEPVKVSKKEEKEKHQQEIQSMSELIELIEDTVKENPSDTATKEYLELLQDTLADLKTKKFEDGGGVGEDIEKSKEWKEYQIASNNINHFNRQNEFIMVNGKAQMNDVTKMPEYKILNEKFEESLKKVRSIKQYATGGGVDEEFEGGDSDEKKNITNKFVYKFHEERGEISAYVEDMTNGNTVWEFKYPDHDLPEEEREMQSSPVDDGFLRHWEDINGLEIYLKQLSIIPEDAELVSEVEANNNYHYYKRGGGVGEKYQAGDYVFAKANRFDTRIKDESAKIPFFVSHWSHDKYYVLGDGSHYLSENELTPATEKDFNDYYGENASAGYKHILKKGGSVGVSKSKGSKGMKGKFIWTERQSGFTSNIYSQESFEEVFNELKNDKDYTLESDHKGGKVFVRNSDQHRIIYSLKEVYEDGGSVNEGKLNCEINAMRNIVYFAYNFPYKFIDSVWGSESMLTAHINSKFDGFAKSKKNSAVGLLYFITDLDSGNQKKLFTWVANNYQAFSTPLNGSFGDDDMPCKINAMRNMIYFMFNYPHGFVEKAFDNDKHLSDTFSRIYNNVGSSEAVLKFTTDLSSGNQTKLFTWIAENYKSSSTPLMADGGSIKNKDRVEIVLKHYIIAALWSSTDDEDQSFDSNYSYDEFDKDNLEKIRQRIIKFMIDNASDLKASGLNDEQIGHDLWLTQVGHGAGFWDREGIDKELGDRLSSASKQLGESAYVFAQDGKVYIDGGDYAKGGGVGDSTFNNDGDAWFDGLAELSSDMKGNENMEKLLAITNKQATKLNLEKFKAILKKCDCPNPELKKKIISHLDKVIAGKYKKEFKFSFGGGRGSGGKVSAGSEFFSKFNQAATYNQFAKGGGVGEKYTVGDKVKIELNNGKIIEGKLEKENPIKVRTDEKSTQVIPNALIKSINKIEGYATGGGVDSVIIPNPNYKYQNIANRWIEDRGNSLQYKIVVALLENKSIEDIEASIGFNSEKNDNDYTKLYRMFRFIDSISESKHEMSWRVQNLSLYEGYQYAKDSAKEMFSLKNTMKDGGGVGEEKIKVRNIDDNSVRTWTVSELLGRINEDNSDDENNYDENDWVEGFIETLEGEFYSLKDKKGKPLNDLSKYIKGNKKPAQKHKSYSLATGGGVGEEKPEGYRYLTLQKVKGGLKVSIDDEGIEEVTELKANGKSDSDIWFELFENIHGNSEYIFHSDMGESGFGMTNAEGITDGYQYEGERDEMYKTDYPESAKIYWFPNYMVESALDTMMEHGSVTFTEAEEMKRGGSIKSKNWIAGALSGGKNKGALKRTALRKGLIRTKDEKLSKTDLHKLEKMGGKTSKRAHLAETLTQFDEGGGVGESWIDISNVIPAKLKVDETTAYGNPEYLNIMYNGKKIARFYFNMRGYNQDFSLKNKEGVYFGFGGDKSKTTQLSDFKKGLRDGFTLIKNYK